MSTGRIFEYLKSGLSWKIWNAHHCLPAKPNPITTNFRKHSFLTLAIEAGFPHPS